MRAPAGVSLEVPTAYTAPASPPPAVIQLQKVDAGDFSAAQRVTIHIHGGFTPSALPSVQTAFGEQGQLPLSLPGWDAVLAQVHELPTEGEVWFALEAVPNGAGRSPSKPSTPYAGRSNRS